MFISAEEIKKNYDNLYYQQSGVWYPLKKTFPLIGDVENDLNAVFIDNGIPMGQNSDFRIIRIENGYIHQQNTFDQKFYKSCRVKMLTDYELSIVKE